MLPLSPIAMIISPSAPYIPQLDSLNCSGVRGLLGDGTGSPAAMRIRLGGFWFLGTLEGGGVEVGFCPVVEGVGSTDEGVLAIGVTVGLYYYYLPI